MNARDFLLKCPGSAKIVSSDQLTEMQIAMAKAEDRFFVDKETMLGWAIVKG
jgi:hypothetical protein